MCLKKKYVLYLLCAFILGAQFFVYAQPGTSFCKDAVKEKREKFYKSTLAAIKQSMSAIPTAANEDDWLYALSSLNLIKYTDAFINAKIDVAVKNIQPRRTAFKKVLIELINSDYPGKYSRQIKNVFFQADDAKLLAMAANYILPTASAAEQGMMHLHVLQHLLKAPDNAVLFQLNEQINNWGKKIIVPSIQTFFAADYLPGQVLVFSFQRKDRNFPGLAMVRKADGSLLKNADGSVFWVGQLARSESNMPGYISLGNTPQGIFRMDGFDTSKSTFIGPTTNIQLTMPFEYKASHFYGDSTLSDSVWTTAQYAKLLPENFKNYAPMYGSYYAGKAGRNEIIAHGTTIDPSFYKNKSYYPYTPTAGCLAAKEIWNDKGYLETSDQLLLARAVQAAGGAKGYLILIETDDKKEKMSGKDLQVFLK